MLIDIPEQKNCWHCGFLDYEQGFCILKNMIECGDMYGPYHTKGYGENSHLEEDRPDWCPFKDVPNEQKGR